MWPFTKKKPVDKLDGYKLDTPNNDDPWQSPAVLAAMEQRAKAGSRMDAEAFDSYKNELTGVGDFLRDKTFGGKQGGPDFEVTLLAGAECEARWRGSDIGGRLIETIPDEMTREGFEISVQPSDDDEDEDDDKADAFPQQPPQPGVNPILAMPPPEAPSVGVLPEIDDEGAEMVEAIEGALEELGIDEALWKALCYERAYGGGAILIGADDGMPLDTPLDEKRIKSVRYLNAFRGGWDGEVVAWSYYRDPSQPKYGQPMIYMLRNLGVPISQIPAPSGAGSSSMLLPDPTPSMGNYGSNGYGPLIFWVHESRLLLFPGVAVSHRIRVLNRGWGDSLFTRVDRVLSQYDQTWGGVANLMTDFSQGILKIKSLADMMGANNQVGNTASLSTRARALNMSRSISRILLIDSEEEFSRDTVSLGGISDILQQFALRLAAAADMPVALLMGQAPAGLNATGASDIRFFYDRVASKQKRRLLPQLKRLLKLLMLSKEGPTEGVEPERWHVKFNSLYQLSELEQATLRKTVADTDAVYITAGVVTPEEVAASRYAGSEWSMETTIDFEGRAAMAEQDAADKEARAKALLEAAKNPPVPVTTPAEPKTADETPPEEKPAA